MRFFETLFKKIPKDFAIVYIFDVISKVFAIVIALFVIRLISIEEYADFTLFNSIATFLFGILGSGLALSFVRYYVEQKSREQGLHNGLFTNVLILIAVIFIIIYVGLYFVQLFVSVPIIFHFAILYALFFSLGNINQAYFQANKNFEKAGFVSNIKNVMFIFMIAVSYLYSSNMKLNTILYIFIISSAISFVIGLFLVYKNGEKASFENTSILKSMFLDSFWLIVYCFLLNLFNQLDIFMLKAFTTDYTVAQYGVAFKYYGIALSLLPVIQTVLRVKTSDKNIIDNKEKQISMTLNWIKTTTPLSIIMVVLAISLSGVIMPILNTSNYNAAIPLFNILMIGVGISYITAPNMGVMMAAGKHKLLCFIALLAFLINLIGNYLFIPMYGAIAATIATIVAQGFLNISCTLAILLKRR